MYTDDIRMCIYIYIYIKEVYMYDIYISLFQIDYKKFVESVYIYVVFVYYIKL